MCVSRSFVALACALFAAGCGGSGSSTSPPPGGTATCGAPLLRHSDPAVVVVLLDGVGSEEGGGTFDPFPGAAPDSVSSYCPLDANRKERRWPAGLDDALRRWAEFKVPGGSSGGSSSAPGTSDACEWPGATTNSCLVGALARTGAVLLPYSYVKGNGVTRTATGVKFTMTGYTADDTRQPIATSIDALDEEIGSLRAAWPSTPIVLIGHSYGGLVAEEWWEQAWAADDHRGVAHVFSLDSPINGVFQCTGTAAFQGLDLSTEFCRRRESLTSDRAIDTNIIHLGADGSYTAVGTVGDPTYSGSLPGNGGGGLEDQVVYKCNDRGDKNTACVASPPSLVINADPNDASCREGSSSLYGTTGHDIVKACPTVVAAVVAAVKAAEASPTRPEPPPPTNAGQSPEQQAEIAVVHHWLGLMSTTQSSEVSKDFNQVVGKQAMRNRLVIGVGTAPAQVIAAPDRPAGNPLSLQFHFVYRSPQEVKAPNQPGGLGVVSSVPVDGDIGLRVVSVADSGENLSQADTANGITFRGSVSIQIVNRWRADAGRAYSRFADYTYTAGVTLQDGKAKIMPSDYNGAWVSGGFDGIEYPADVPFSVVCQLGATGQYPDYVGSNGQPPAGC